MAAQHGQRGLELVAGVVEEAALLGEGGLEPVQHGVDGAGEGGDVVVPGEGDAPAEVGLGDLLGGAPQAPQGRQQPPGQQEGRARDEQQRQRGDDGVGAHRVPERGAADVEPGDHEQGSGLAVAAEPDGLTHQQDLALAGHVEAGAAPGAGDVGGGRAEGGVVDDGVLGGGEEAHRVPPPLDPAHEQLVVVGDVALEEQLQHGGDVLERLGGGGIQAPGLDPRELLQLLVHRRARLLLEAVTLDGVDQQPGQGQGRGGEGGDDGGDPGADRDPGALRSPRRRRRRAQSSSRSSVVSSRSSSSRSA